MFAIFGVLALAQPLIGAARAVAGDDLRPM